VILVITLKDSIENIKPKRLADGRWQIILGKKTYTVSEFLNEISNRSFQLSDASDRAISALEKEAMFLFVNGGDYTLYNRLLRNREIHPLNSRLLKKTLVRIVAMQSGINKLPDYSGYVYRVASVGQASTETYNGIGDGSLSVDTITTTNTFVGACRFAFVVVEHAPVIVWTIIKTLRAKVQPESTQEVTFPLGTSIQFSKIRQLDPNKIIGHIDPDAELKWVQIGSKYRPFIGLNLYYEGERLPDFYFLSEPRQFRRPILHPLTFLLERSKSFYKTYALRELEQVKRLPAEKRFEQMWTSRLDSASQAGQLPKIIYLAEAQEIPS
jgi:hypothetical protein